MKIEKFNVHDLGSGNASKVVPIPVGSQFMTLFLMGDNIYAYYLIPELEGVPFENVSYMVAGKDTSIDTSKQEYVDSIEFYHDERIIVFHVFREKEQV